MESHENAFLLETDFWLGLDERGKCSSRGIKSLPLKSRSNALLNIIPEQD